MKTCIVGAGAIGGLIGTRLAAGGQADVRVYARGATLQAVRSQGLQVEDAGGGVLRAHPRASDRAEDLGVQELVILAVKGPALPGLVGRLGPLIGPRTVLLPAMNGVPWWFCQGMPQPAGGGIEAVDPGGSIGRALPFEQVLGCVVHMSASVEAPGRIRHRNGLGLIVGEPRDGAASARVLEVIELLRAAGFEATASEQIRRDIWFKLWGNLTMNPVSALTGATIDRILGDPLLRAFCSGAMREAAAIGARIGCPIEQDPEDRHAVTARLGAFKTSMLQDVEGGRAIELDAIVGAVHELGLRVGVEMPLIGGLLGFARVMARARRLYPG